MDNNLDNNQGGRRPDKGDPRRDLDPNRNKKNHQSILAFLICLLVTLVCFSLFTNMLQDNSSEITYDKFIDMVNNDEVKSVTLQSDNLTIVPKKQVNPYQEISYYTNLTEMRLPLPNVWKEPVLFLNLSRRMLSENLWQ